MHADGMAAAECDRAQDEKGGECLPCEQKRTGDERDCGHGADPNRFHRLPFDDPGHWIALIVGDHSYRTWHQFHHSILPPESCAALTSRYVRRRSFTRALSRLSGRDTGQTSCTKPLSVLARLSLTSE